jgi:hypothetical protein
MASTLLPIRNVPQAEVGRTVQQFIDFDGCTDIEVEIQSDGRFTITPQA